MNVPAQTINRYLKDWKLSNPKKIDVSSACSDVFIVKMENEEKAVLKIRYGRGIKAEQYGAAALNYFDGHGIVQLYKYDDRAHLLEYIEGSMLRGMVDKGFDNKATAIICDIIADLHKDRDKPIPKLNSLENHCAELFNQARKPDASDVLIKAAEIGAELLANQINLKPLHGDVHHENILMSDRGWILIDPNGLIGDPVYEYANIFHNPIKDRKITNNPDRIQSVATIICEKTGYDRDKILKYGAMHIALSASWAFSTGYEESGRKFLKNCDTILKLVM